MRGKLRDKRIDVRRERAQRDLLERRRPLKRENRAVALLNRQLEEDVPVEEEDSYEYQAR